MPVLLAASIFMAGSARAGDMEAPLIPRAAFSFDDRSGSFARISPDGRRLAYLAPKDGVLNIWTVPPATVKGATPVTADTKRGLPPAPPIWTMDSRHILFYQDTDGDGQYRLYSIDVETRQTRVLTPADPKVSAFPVSDSLSPRSRPSSLFMMINDRDAASHDLYEVDLTTDRRRLVERNELGFNLFWLDSDLLPRLAAKSTGGGGEELYGRSGQRWTKVMSWSADDSTNMGLSAVLGVEGTGRTALVKTSKGRDKPALIRLNLETGEQSIVAADQKESAKDDVLIDPRTGTLQAYTMEYLTRRHVAVVDDIRADIDRIEKQLGPQYVVTSRSADDTKWTIEVSDPARGVATFLYERVPGKLAKLFDNYPRLAGAPLQPMHALEIRARDGVPLPAYLTLPPGSDKDRKGRPDRPLPLVLNVHGGPSDRDEYMFRSDHQWLANRGYAVLSVNFRGSHGFGRAFLHAGNGELGGKMQDDLIDAVNWAVREGIARRDKVAIYGISYGGYAVLAGLTRTPDVYSCGVDMVGPSDMLAAFEEPMAKHNPALRRYQIELTGADPDTKLGQAKLAELSPVTHAERVTKPLLVMHGSNDPAVSRKHSDRMVEALRGNGRPVTYVLYPDEGHGFIRPQNARSSEAIVEMFLAQCLGGRVEPLGEDAKGSSVQVVEGAQHIHGLDAALQAKE